MRAPSNEPSCTTACVASLELQLTIAKMDRAAQNALPRTMLCSRCPHERVFIPHKVCKLLKASREVDLHPVISQIGKSILAVIYILTVLERGIFDVFAVMQETASPRRTWGCLSCSPCTSHWAMTLANGCWKWGPSSVPLAVFHSNRAAIMPAVHMDINSVIRFCSPILMTGCNPLASSVHTAGYT
jgi:hypothetical protein